MIEVKNLTKKYGNHTAVDGLSFRIEKGRIYGFLGPNGAGKSTTMNIITGYVAASDGDVLIDGVDILKEPEKAKAMIGYLPELPPLYADMTVKEYLDFVAELKKVESSSRKEAVEKVMEQTNITDMSRRLIRNLSKGYKQRVGMAQAILGNPEVLIFDEPSVGLDPRQIIEVRDLIKELGKEHTVILSSHILSEVSAVCDHILILSGGKLVADGSPEELSAMMGDAGGIEITVIGSGETALDIIKQMPQVLSAAFSGQDESGNAKILVSAKDGADVREELSFKLSENRIAVIGMEKKERSLEDIFLELTESNEAAKEEE
ncbi:MAG: ATP-binding cassette domain-containing protein [Lachnospiraceae bacterium]|nr:ATP-binding cassette domain-containing protein [Lachnospiraceae bacterium]